MEIKKVVSYINRYKSLNSEDVLGKLTNNTDLSQDEKNLIYLYLFPRPLKDRELPERFKQVRKTEGGSIEVSIPECTIIIEAGRTEQYSRFIKHLFHSFSDLNTVYPIEGSNICNCCLCGKEIYETTLWNSFRSQYGGNENDEKLFQAFGSTESNLPICIPCLLNLSESIRIMKEIDPNFIFMK